MVGHLIDSWCRFDSAVDQISSHKHCFFPKISGNEAAKWPTQLGLIGHFAKWNWLKLTHFLDCLRDLWVYPPSFRKNISRSLTFTTAPRRCTSVALVPETMTWPLGRSNRIPISFGSSPLPRSRCWARPDGFDVVIIAALEQIRSRV